MIVDRVIDPTAQQFRRVFAHQRTVDLIIGLVIAGLAFYLYAQSLVPGVLDGDQGEFQYMPAVLGIPHPSGFPLYILLGHLWTMLPIGNLAYRMNLFSAFWGALTVGLLYVVVRLQKLARLAALGAALALALMPEFWQYSTAAAVYRLHDFLIVLLFALLAQWESTRCNLWLLLGALAFGLDLANHLTILFIAPATALLLLLVWGRSLPKQLGVIFASGVLLALPLLLYLYFPLRALQLFSNSFVLPDWPKAVSQGIVSPYYPPDPTQLFGYIVGGAFFSSVTGHWQWQWDHLLGDWVSLTLEGINWPLALLGLAGIVSLAIQRVKLAAWLVVVAVTFQLLALQYSYEGLGAIGQFSSYFREYYLPGFIALIILAGWGLDGILRLLNLSIIRIGIKSRVAASLVPGVLIVAFLVPSLYNLVAQHSAPLAARSAEIQAKWDMVERFPPEPGAVLVGHWGDMTPLWYLQYAQGWRQDLLTIHPPDETRIRQWLASGRPLYLAGSLLNWAPGLADDYHLTPWGPLVRVTTDAVSIPSPLSQHDDLTFQDDHPVLRLSGHQVSNTTVHVGSPVNVSAYWQTLDSISLDDYVVYLSLESPGDDAPASSYPLVVDWLPGNKLVQGQSALSWYPLTVPWGTPAGAYDLTLSVYSLPAARALQVTGKDQALAAADLGTIIVESSPDYPDTAHTEHPANVNFGAQLSLLGWDGELKDLTAGDTSSVRLLWKALGALPGQFTASLTLEQSGDAARGIVSFALGAGALAPNYPSAQWRAGEIVRGTRAFSIPANVPEGDYALVLRVSDESHSTLTVGDGWFSRSDSYTLGHIHVVGRAHSYEIPPIAHPQLADFDKRLSLLGYGLESSQIRAGDLVHMKLYWQAESLMSTSYTCFVHVVDAGGHILTQHDGLPGNGALPTPGWLPREVVTDSFDLAVPGDASPGTWQIQVGWYDAATGARVPVTGGGDYVLLQDVLEVAKP